MGSAGVPLGAVTHPPQSEQSVPTAQNFGSSHSNPWWDDVGNGKMHANLETWDDIPNRLLAGSADGGIALGQLGVESKTGWYATRAMVGKYPTFPSWTALKNESLVRSLAEQKYNFTTKSWTSPANGASCDTEMKGQR